MICFWPPEKVFGEAADGASLLCPYWHFPIFVFDKRSEYQNLLTDGIVVANRLLKGAFQWRFRLARIGRSVFTQRNDNQRVHGILHLTA